ncbi:hypothetical protein LCGC14_1363930 [marine sediment metagenome]|uniref:Uncharacterized protein n=1 Tax=marine sediment metagenome TaxID=412755 RepID=A0A0F9K7T8_9ZZZZ
MFIELIANNDTSKNLIHLSKEVWDISRHSHDAKLQDVLKVDAPVNEMPSAVLKITSTIIEREIIASLKEHVMWACSSRVDEVIEFTLDRKASIKANKYAEVKRAYMKEEKARGVPQDKHRLNLPLLSMTTYIVRLSLRSCAVLKVYFEELAEYGEEEGDIFRGASLMFKDCIMMMGSTYEYPFVELLGASPNHISPNSNYAVRGGSFAIVNAYVPFSLRTHMIRHRLLDVRDQMREWIKHGVSEKSIGDAMNISVSASVEAWSIIMKKRSCWLAQSGMWSLVLNPISEVLGLSKDVLPCNDGVCPFNKDVQLRLEDRDPNAPCPRHAQINDYELSKKHQRAIQNEIDQGGRNLLWLAYKE